MRTKIAIGLIIVAVAGWLIWAYAKNDGNTANALDSFAQCIRDKGVTMYGASSCKYCQQEKKEFGSSFQFIPYVECPTNTQTCIAKNIEGYPTWIFPDGKRLLGFQGVNKLAQETGCEIPREEQPNP